MMPWKSGVKNLPRVVEGCTDMKQIINRVKKIRLYRIVFVFVLLTFLLVFANNFIFMFMKEHAHGKILLVNLSVSVVLTVFIFLVFYLYFKFTDKKAANNLQFDESVLKLVLDNLDTCIYMTNIETNEIIFMNEKMRKEFGGRNLMGEICWKVLQEGFTEQCDFCPVYQLKKDSTKPCVWEENNTVTKKYYENTDTLIKWVDGSMVHMQHSMDITERKKAELQITESLHKLESVMFNYPGLIISFDENRQLSFASGENNDDFDVIKEYLAGNNINHPNFKFEEYKEKMDLAYSGACTNWILEIGDESFNCFLSPIINDDGKVIGALFAANDISKTVKMQKELQKAIDAAEQASKAKSDFLSRMSHEMRTPMNAIIGMTKIAQDSDTLEKVQYCLDKVDISSRHLLGLINDVLDMSKIEANKFVLEHVPFSVEKMVMNTCNIILDKVEEKKQTLDIFLDKDMRQGFIGDEFRLSQVLTNLLSNAIKFTPVEGKITLSVDEIETNEGHSKIRFSVADTGIGISEEQQKRLFNSFEQADDTTARKYGGTGLGLAISKSIVEKMGGKIWIESEQGKGAKFSFDIKLDAAPEIDNKVLFDEIKPSDLKVLVVDDSEDILKYFVEIMDKFGIYTDTADNGHEAVDYVNKANDDKKPYDVIFLDWRMPEMDGIETAKCINTKINKNTTIIMISASEWNDVADLAHSVGINRFIPKPLFPSSILNNINEVVGQTMKKLDIKSMKAKIVDEKPDFSALSVLLVDDVEINREILIAFLKDTKIKVDTAENGAVAVDKFIADPDKYDMIIMDIQMPEMDGYEATRAIRALDTEKAKRVPIIAMTANAFKEDIDKCLESGMDCHLAKPIDKKQVIKTIAGYKDKIRAVDAAIEPQTEIKSDNNIEKSFLPYINVDEMKERLGDSISIYPDLLSNFVQKNMFAEFKEQIDKDDIDSAQKTVHTIKGIVANLSLTEAYNKAIEVEKLIKAREQQQKDIDELQQILITTIEQIRKFLEACENNTIVL